jgi:hypothetical protein
VYGKLLNREKLQKHGDLRDKTGKLIPAKAIGKKGKSQ